MNGIARRFLGGGLGGSSSKDTPPPASEPPQQQPPAVAPLAIGGGKANQWTSEETSPNRTNGSGGRVVDDSTVRQRPPRSSSKSSASAALMSPTGTTPTPAPPMVRAAPQIPLSRPVVNTKGTVSRNGVGATNVHTKDELLMSLLASEAMVDSRGAEVLSAEQVEELKKEDALLQSRYASSAKKLALETKMRDAARSLVTLNAGNKSMSRQTQEQLEVASQRLESAQADHLQIQSRAAEVRRRLLEHRAAVLSAALRKSEEDERSSATSSNTLSPTSTTATSVSGSALSRFDGAHLFAGHAGAATPISPRPTVDYEQMAERVRAAEESAKAAAKKVAELNRDLGLLKLEKAQAETTAALEVQQAEELVADLRREVSKLNKTQAWEKEREELVEDVAQRDKQIEELQERLETVERDAASRPRGSVEATETDVELEGARKALRAIVRSQRLNMHAIASSTGQGEAEGSDASVFSVANMVAAIAAHVESLDEGKKTLEKAKRELENQLHDEQLAKEKLLRNLDESRQDTQESLRQIGTLERQMQEQTDRIVELSRSESSGMANVESTSAELQRIMSVLNPLWALLPSAEGRASKLSSTQANRDPNALNSPILGSPRTGRPPNAPPLISDADIRSLRMLYDPHGPFMAPPPPGKFSIEAFATKIRALVADDRAIVERLLKFASTHELLKTNAEKAQKLAQESTISLKTYQDQVRTLEERNNTLAGQQAALLEELEQAQAAYEELLEIRQQLEVDAARQAEVCANLTEANNQLSARALKLAEDSANVSAPVVAARAKLEAEAAEQKKKIEELESELKRVRDAEEDQRIVLLDAVNSTQTENMNLRNQLRALQAR